MTNWQKWLLGVLVLVVVGGGATFLAGGGLSGSEHADVLRNLDAARAQLSAAEGDLGVLAVDRDGLQAELDAATAQLSAAGGPEEVEALRCQITDLELQLSTVEADLETQRNLIIDLGHDLDAEQQGRADAEGIGADLLVAYDAELAASRDALLGSIGADICRLHPDTPAGIATVIQTVRSVIGGSPEYSAAFTGYEVPTTFDVDALLAVVAECQRVEAEVAPKGNGFYTVGVEIAPGLWHSTGDGDLCYWERLDQDQQNLGNHFGTAGGTVNVLETDYEVEFDNCGTWEYLGPVPVLEEEEEPQT